MPGAVEKLGFSPNGRKMLFYGVCIPIRLSMVYIAASYYKNTNFQIIALIFAGISIATNIGRMSDTNDPVWWNRVAHIIFALIGASTIVMDKPQHLSKVLLADILFGVVDSIIKRPF